MAPMPNAMVKRAVNVNPGELRRERTLIRRLRSKASMNSPFDTGTQLSRHVSGQTVRGKGQSFQWIAILDFLEMAPPVRNRERLFVCEQSGAFSRFTGRPLLS